MKNLKNIMKRKKKNSLYWMQCWKLKEYLACHKLKLHSE